MYHGWLATLTVVRAVIYCYRRTMIACAEQRKALLWVPHSLDLAFLASVTA